MQDFSGPYTALFLDTDLLEFGFTGPKNLRGFRETCPWSGTLSCVLGQGAFYSILFYSFYSILTVPLSTQVYNWILVNCWGNLKTFRGNDLRWTSTHPGGVEILLAASCQRNRDKLWQLQYVRARLAPRLHF